MKRQLSSFELRVKQKQESRDQDARDLAAGIKTREQLRVENGIKLSPGQVKIDFSKIKKL